MTLPFKNAADEAIIVSFIEKTFQPNVTIDTNERMQIYT